MARVRNEGATCGTCPYFLERAVPPSNNPFDPPDPPRPGFCRLTPTSGTTSHELWCGEHPDFWTEAPTD